MPVFSLSFTNWSFTIMKKNQTSFTCCWTSYITILIPKTFSITCQKILKINMSRLLQIFQRPLRTCFTLPIHSKIRFKHTIPSTNNQNGNNQNEKNNLLILKNNPTPKNKNTHTQTGTTSPRQWPPRNSAR